MNERTNVGTNKMRTQRDGEERAIWNQVRVKNRNKALNEDPLMHA